MWGCHMHAFPSAILKAVSSLWHVLSTGKPVPLFIMEKFIITGNCCPNCRQPDIALPQHQTRKSFCALICILEKFCWKLNGIFAFAIWDDANRELLLYRDRAGTKPLFYTQTGSSFVLDRNPKHYFVIRMSLHPLTKTVCRKFWRSVRHAPPETAYSQA